MNGDLFTPLSTICIVRSGQTFKKRLDEYPKGDITVLLPKDIINNKIADSPVKVDPISVPQLHKHLLKKGDILIVNKGTRFNTYLYNEEAENVVTTTAFYVITPGKAVIPEYLYWYLNQEEAKEYLTANVQGSVIPTITKSIVEQLPVPLIQLDAQHYVNTFIEKSNIEQELFAELIQKKKAFADSFAWECIQKFDK